MVDEMNNIKVKFIVSEGIETQQNGFQQRQAIINPVLVFSTPFIPTSLSIGLTIVIIGLEKTKHSFSIKLKNIEKNKIIFDSGNAEAEIGDLLDNFVLNADLKNIGFETEGDYDVLLSIDGEEYNDTFSVRKALEKNSNL